MRHKVGNDWITRRAKRRARRRAIVLDGMLKQESELNAFLISCMACLGRALDFTFTSIMVTTPDCLPSAPPVAESKLLLLELLPLPALVPVKPAATCSPSSRRPLPKDLAAFSTVAV